MQDTLNDFISDGQKMAFGSESIAELLMPQTKITK
jgi:hypothetical protein